MEKDTVIKLLLSVTLAVYLVFALSTAGTAERSSRYVSLSIEVADSIGSGFITADDVSRECGDLRTIIGSRPRSEIDISELESSLNRMPQIERANVASMNDGSLRIDVEPMLPVARVFEPGGESYYINASGKRVKADVKYHVDVPVVVGRFKDSRQAASLLPMLSYVADDPTLDALVSTVTTTDAGDIIIVPVIRGQVINFGDTTSVADKFMRLKAFYRKVMPVKGWDFYDTISVKWRGQIVANRRDKRLGKINLETEDSDFDLIDDVATMSPEAEGIVDDQTAAGPQSDNSQKATTTS